MIHVNLPNKGSNCSLHPQLLVFLFFLAQVSPSRPSHQSAGLPIPPEHHTGPLTIGPNSHIAVSLIHINPLGSMNRNK